MPSTYSHTTNNSTSKLGHIAIQIAARGMGMRVIGIDSPSKKDLIKECGAEVYINHEDGNAEEEVKKATGSLGAQAVLVLTAANGAYASAMGLLRYGGTLVAVGAGRIDPGDIAGILGALDRRAAGPVAPPRGLTLWRVVYGRDRRTFDAPREPQVD